MRLSLKSLEGKLRRYSKKHSRKGLYEGLSEAIETYCVGESMRILNVGSGGEVQSQLDALGLDVTSMDIDSARKPDVVMDLEDMNAIDGASFDLVLLVEVLEHLKNPQRGVAEIRRVLRPGGIVIGSTPFMLGVHDHPHDYYRFTHFGLSYLFRDFEELVLRARNGYMEAVSVLCLRLFNVGSREQRRRALLLSPILLLQSLLLRVIGRAIESADATTGYFFVYRRPGVGPSS